MFKFRQLSDRTKQKVVKEYIEGWKETHVDDYLPKHEVYDMLYQEDDEYDELGNLIEE